MDGYLQGTKENVVYDMRQSGKHLTIVIHQVHVKLAKT